METDSIKDEEKPTILTDSESKKSSAPINTEDEETKRRKLMMKLWGKGNKSSQKIRELEKSSATKNSDNSNKDQDEESASKCLNDDGANSINTNKPYAVVKPIIMKTGGTTNSTSERSRVNSETSSDIVSQTEIDSSTTNNVEQVQQETEVVSSSEIVATTSSRTERISSVDESKTRRKDRSRSKERDQRKSRAEESRQSNRKSETNRQSDRPSFRSTDERNSRSNQEENSSRHGRRSRSTSRSRRRRSNERRQINEKPKLEKSQSEVSERRSEISEQRSNDKSRNESSRQRRSSSNSTFSSRSKSKIDQTSIDSSRNKPKQQERRRGSRNKTRSRTPEQKIDKKSNESPSKQKKTVNESESNRLNETSHRERTKSTRESPTTKSSERRRRKSSSESFRKSRRDSSSHNDKRRDQPTRNHSHYSNDRSHRHNDDHRRSNYSHSHRHRSPPTRHDRYRRHRYSSSSSSRSFSPYYRRGSTRSSSSTTSSTSFTSMSRTSSSSSNSRSRNPSFNRRKRFRRSPTLERILLKASESIESVSTQRDPLSKVEQSIPVRTLASSTTNSQIALQMTSTSETNSFYSETFSGFSVPPPPFVNQPQQRCLKEISTDGPIPQRPILNELRIQLPNNTNELNNQSHTESNHFPRSSTDKEISPSVQLPSVKAPRVSRFSDISSTELTSQTANNNDIPLDASLNYTKIMDNIYCLPSNRRFQNRHNREVFECECTTNEEDRARGIKACGSQCLNRMLLIECGPSCPCGEYCTNRRFQRRSYVSHKLTLFKTDMKGYGIRTKMPIRKGRFLVEYVGEVIDMDELARRSKKYKREGHTHEYVMSLIHGTVIDSTTKGNWARFINHSCEPNCSAEKWLVNGEYRMGLFSKRDLNAGEEITIDYRFETFGTGDSANEKCYCGAPTCRGTINVKNNVSNNTNSNSSKKRSTRRQSMDDDELIVYLRDEDTDEYIIPKTIEEIRQLIQIMSRTDSEHIRLMELDLLRFGSQKQLELARLFLECNGLHVLSSWMKDILIRTDNQNVDLQYSDEFKNSLLDFMQDILPIKDRTALTKHGLLTLVEDNLKLNLKTISPTHMNEQQHIEDLMNSMLEHLSNPIINKLYDLRAKWNSLKERFIIPKRKDSQGSSEQSTHQNHHHHNHHHHHHHYRNSSRRDQDDNNHRPHFSSRSSETYRRSSDRSTSRRSFIPRDNHRSHELKLSKDERRRLFEQQYEDEERAKAAAAIAASAASSSTTTAHIENTQNEPPHKKQRTWDSTDLTSGTGQFPTTDNQSHDQMYWLHQYLSQIPVEHIRSYLNSIGQLDLKTSDSSIPKTEKNLLQPPLPITSPNENELPIVFRLPVGWSVAQCPSDLSVYFYNEQTNTSTWTPPTSIPAGWLPNMNDQMAEEQGPLNLSPLSSAQITEQKRVYPPNKESLSSKATKVTHRHQRIHRHHQHHHHHHHHHLQNQIMLSHKRKRPIINESLSVNHTEPQSSLTVEKLNEHNEQNKEDNENDGSIPKQSSSINLASLSDQQSDTDPSSAMLKAREAHASLSDDQTSLNDPNTTASSSALETNRDLLRRNISQHIHVILKPYTKRTCKHGRITSSEDMKHLVKKFTLVVLDKEIEKAKNDGVSLSSVLSDRVRLKTELYVKKYMNKMGSVFQRHDPTVAHRPLTSTAEIVAAADNSTPQMSQQTVQSSPAAMDTVNTE